MRTQTPRDPRSERRGEVERPRGTARPPGRRMFAGGPAAAMALAPGVVVGTAVVVDGVVGATAAAIIAAVVPDRVVGAVAGRRGPVVVAPVVVAPLGAAV